MNKTVRLGTVKGWLGREEGPVDVFCSIKLKDGRLSISGVEGPRPNGDCWDSCGQIVMSLRGHEDDITPAPGWTPELVREFLKTWDVWHLNDMRAGCEHQRRDWDVSAKLEIVTYRLTMAAMMEKHALRKDVDARLARGETVALTDTERAILDLPYHIPGAPDADSIRSGRYEVDKRETKNAGWVYPAEHSGGLLCKPCPECGYKYGSKWLREDVPAEVVAFLESLPDTDKTPAWV